MDCYDFCMCIITAGVLGCALTLGCPQVLNIPTKINKGTVEITTNVALIKAGDKVGASEATLLSKLGIKPFSYGLIVKHVSTLHCMFWQRLHYISIKPFSYGLIVKDVSILQMLVLAMHAQVQF